MAERKTFEITKLTAPDEIAQALAERQQKLARLSLAPANDVGLVFEDEFLRIHRDPVRFPSGRLGTYLCVEERWATKGIGGVVIVPVSSGCIYFQRAYRYPTRSWEWELPRGNVDAGASPEQAARRELAEEAGLTASNWIDLGTIQSNSGLFATSARAYLATTESNTRAPEPEAGEAIGDRRLIPVAQVWTMLAKGEIRDGFSLSALALALWRGLLAMPARKAGER